MMCQPSYLSQVLHGQPHLTLEQAHRLTEFFELSSLEAKYFILMVEFGRAGTQELGNFFRDQLNEIRETRFNFKKRLTRTDDIPLEARHRYYSTWFYSAIHVALSIRELQDPSKLATMFHLPLSLVREVIEFLLETGLVEKSRGQYHLTNRRFHLERESEFIQRHHINWRSQALQAAERNLRGNLHYSNVIAVSEKDSEKIKEILVKSIQDTRKLIGPSKEEKVYAITLDFFQL